MGGQAVIRLQIYKGVHPLHLQPSHSIMSKAEAKRWIEAKLAEKKVVVFSKTTCPFCHMAKAALEGHDYLWIEIEKMPNMAAIQDALLEMTGGRTVPRVFIGGKCIGGGSETRDAKASGELDRLIAAA